MSRLFDAHARGLHRYLARRVGEAAAEDLVAETFVAAWADRARYEPERAEIRVWLYGIATNLCRRHRRQELRALAATARAGGQESLMMDGPADVVAGQVDAQARVRRLAAALVRLPDADRDTLLLTAWAGLSNAEVAEALGVPAGTVRSRLHRVRQLLRTEEGRTGTAQATFGVGKDKGGTR
ncbi:hypothetical protein ALI144C_29770 [Actinosynnema sp. ALI-1.44]|nr:hypothetical protein ALI144C_29770 [Actinosynnema sp. ALI-1.44]